MPEAGRQDVSFCSGFFLPIKILFYSLRIFLRNKQIFISIFALTTFPLACLLVSLSISTYPLLSKIQHLEAVSVFVPTRFEARHIWEESRKHAISLLRTKAIFFLPCYILSLIAAISAVSTTVLSYSGKRPTTQLALIALKNTWKCLLVTTLVVYLALLAYAVIPRTLSAFAGSAESRFLVQLIGSGVELYLISLMGLGLIVSIVEEKFGPDAIWVGSDLMKGRRFCGLVLSGLLMLISGVISLKLESVMDGQDASSDSNTSSSSSSPSLTTAMVIALIKDNLGLICLYGFVSLWSYVMTAVFYCECRRRHPMNTREDNDENLSV